MSRASGEQPREEHRLRLAVRVRDLQEQCRQLQLALRDTLLCKQAALEEAERAHLLGSRSRVRTAVGTPSSAAGAVSAASRSETETHSTDAPDAAATDESAPSRSHSHSHTASSPSASASSSASSSSSSTSSSRQTRELSAQTLQVARLAQLEVARGAASLQVLESSSATIAATAGELHSVTSHVTAARGLLNRFARRDLTDRVVLSLALLFFAAVVLYILKKRVFSLLPLPLALNPLDWWPSSSPSPSPSAQTPSPSETAGSTGSEGGRPLTQFTQVGQGPPRDEF